jgi:preflagellin peptidase FlaK
MSPYGIAVLIVSIILVSASVQDVRRREVDDPHWMAICAVAFLLPIWMPDPGSGALMSSGVVLLSLYMFSERVVGKVSLIAVSAGALCMVCAYLRSSDPGPLVAACMSLAVVAMYSVGMIRGGADAKALLSLSMAFPMYAGMGCLAWEPVYPAALVFNPVFSAMALSMPMSLLAAIPISARNTKGGRCGLTSYRMGIEDARSSYVWPLEDAVGGRVVHVGIAEDTGPVYDRLEELGCRDVRVTPMIPYVLPLTASFILVAVLGSPLMALAS